ncbi:hypothetical protein P3T39_005998 [Kitasatospora sp. GP82]|nr:hypothetical protein [Kitasatospora sp. GP82]
MPPEQTVMESNPPGVTANDCPSCAGFDAVAAKYPENRTILNMVSKWRAQHADWDECTNPRGGTGD